MKVVSALTRSSPARTESWRRSPPEITWRTFRKTFCLTSSSNSDTRSGRAIRMISFTDSVRSNASIVCARTGRSPSKASSLSNPIRWLLPAATMMTLSMRREENAERPTSNGRCRMQRLLIWHWAFGVGCSAFSSSQLLLHFRAQHLSIRASRDLHLQCFHYRAHLRLRGRADFRNGFADKPRQFFRAQSFRQIRIENFQLRLFLRGQLGPSALLETLNRILALFHLFADYLDRGRVIQMRVGFFDGRVLQRRLQTAQDSELASIFRAHRVQQLGINPLLQSHGVNLQRPQFFHAHMDRRRIAHTDDLRILLCPAQQTSEHFPRSKLDEKIAAALEQALHAIAPEHRTGDLILQGRANFRERFDRAAGDVTHHRETRRLKRGFQYRLLELFVCAVHQ